MKIAKKLIVLALGSMLVYSCGGNKEPEVINEEAEMTEPVIKDTTPVTVSDTTKYKFDFVLANIPSPASSVQDLATFGVPYDNSILNDTKNVTRYNTEFKRGINLGIYNIDMAYAMMNEKGQDVLQYMKDILTISDALGLKSAVSVMVGKRAESNLNNRDSLFGILDEIFVKSDSYLRTNERVFTAATVFSGSWLESLYLTCRISEQVNDIRAKERARKLLWEQRFHLGNLINVLKDYKDKKECAALIADLQVIHESIMAVKQVVQLNDDKFKAISSKIYALRTKLTS